MELGGKNPMIVLEDADPGRAAEIASARASTTPASSASGSSGSTSSPGCYDAFMDRFLARIGALRMHASVGGAPTTAR